MKLSSTREDSLHINKLFPLTDEVALDEAGITDGAKIHLMVKKGEMASPSGGAGSSKNVASSPDFFIQLESFLSKHLTQEQTTKVVCEFKKVISSFLLVCVFMFIS